MQGTLGKQAGHDVSQKYICTHTKICNTTDMYMDYFQLFSSERRAQNRVNYLQGCSFCSWQYLIIFFFTFFLCCSVFKSRFVESLCRFLSFHLKVLTDYEVNSYLKCKSVVFTLIKSFIFFSQNRILHAQLPINAQFTHKKR